MTELSSLFKQLPRKSVPSELASKVQRGILFRKIRTWMYGAYTLVVLNAILSGWHMWNRMIERDTLELFKASIDTYRTGVEELQEFVTALWVSMPHEATLIFLVNSALVLIGIAFFLHSSSWLRQYDV